MNEYQPYYDLLGVIVISFVVPTLVWVINRIINMTKAIAVLETQMEANTAENLRRHNEIMARFDKNDVIAGRIFNQLSDLQIKFSNHNGWERHRAEQEDDK